MRCFPGLTWRLIPGLALITLCLACASPGRGEVWSAVVENDSATGDDGNYSNAVSIGWQSARQEAYGEGNVPGRILAALDFLPFTDGGDRRVSLRLAQAVFTPEDLKLDNPPPDARPYAGILVLDGALIAGREDRMDVWSLRVGAVGNVSGAEEFQKELHEWFPADRPKGWSHQLHDEPLLNAGYEHHRRVWRGEVFDGMEADLTPNLGGAVGNYLIAANVGLWMRTGWNLRDRYGWYTPRTGFETEADFSGPSEETQIEFHGGGEAYLVGHFLPLDGNTWEDSRSTDREDFVYALGGGMGYARGSFTARLTYYYLSDTYEAQEDRVQVLALSLSWLR